jgi:hypothetical protein
MRPCKLVCFTQWRSGIVRSREAWNIVADSCYLCRLSLSLGGARDPSVTLRAWLLCVGAGLVAEAGGAGAEGDNNPGAATTGEEDSPRLRALQQQVGHGQGV